VTDAASRGFLVLAFRLATLCDRRCIEWFPSVSMPLGYTLKVDLYLVTPCDRRCIAWFPSVSMSYGYTLNFDTVTDGASRGFLVLACIWLHLVTDAASRGFLVLACRFSAP